MKNWTLVTLMVQEMPVKVYINAANDHAVIFPLFGRYFQLRSDVNVLDFATTFVVSPMGSGNHVTYTAYLSSSEDTVNLSLEQIAA